MKTLLKYKFLAFLYLMVMALFFFYYGSFPFGFNFHIYFLENIGQIGLILVNILLFSVFIIFINLKGEVNWKGTGVYIAFFISLFTEMFGIPLAIYFMSSSVGYPILKTAFPFNHIDLRYVFSWDPINIIFCTLGMIFLFTGMVMIFLGWRKVYNTEDVTKDGIYKYIRHPQYLGLLMMTFSWAIVWPTVLTWIMWPILVFIYFKQAKKEERKLVTVFGDSYVEYRKKTRMFIPFIL